MGEHRGITGNISRDNWFARGHRFEQNHAKALAFDRRSAKDVTACIVSWQILNGGLPNEIDPLNAVPFHHPVELFRFAWSDDKQAHIRKLLLNHRECAQ